MAARKKAPEQSSLFAAPPTIQTPPSAPAPLPAEDVPAAPKLRLVPPPTPVPAEDVSVEPLADGRYVVALVRHHGSSVAAVVYTRMQLEMLLRRIPAALAVGL